MSTELHHAGVPFAPVVFSINPHVCVVADLQVCSYRCIVSHESQLLEDFSLCVLQKHNCLGKSAEIPALPDPPPMAAFRGEDLTHELAESLFIGWLGGLLSQMSPCRMLGGPSDCLKHTSWASHRSATLAGVHLKIATTRMLMPVAIWSVACILD